MRKIQNREWLPGALIPKESELAAQYGVARATVNRALQSLAATGLLERRRRAGTRVAQHPARHAQLRIPIVRQEIEAQGRAYGYRLLRQQTDSAPGEADGFFGDIAKGKIIHVVALHLADNDAYIFEDRWISTVAIAAAAEADFAKVSANEWLVNNVPISTGKIAFVADIASPDIAKVFACKTGSPVLCAARKTWHDGAPVTYVRQTFHPGYRLEMDI